MFSKGFHNACITCSVHFNFTTEPCSRNEIINGRLYVIIIILFGSQQEFVRSKTSAVRPWTRVLFEASRDCGRLTTRSATQLFKLRFNRGYTSRMALKLYLLNWLSQIVFVVAVILSINSLSLKDIRCFVDLRLLGKAERVFTSWHYNL